MAEQKNIPEMVNGLEGLLMKVPVDRLEFAHSLISQWKRYGKLSGKQMYWVEKLTQMATGNEEPPMHPEVGDYSKVVDLFETASAKLKSPKIVFASDVITVVFSKAGPTAKYPGSINVASEGGYGSNSWYGRVTRTGLWMPSSAADELNVEERQALESLLIDFGLDPVASVQKYGKKTGMCCFCHSKLTDERSVNVGFGPHCASSYGLKPLWEEAVKEVAA